MSQSPLYDRDFYAWANEQAALLREGKLGDADIEHIAQEIESMGKTEKRELAPTAMTPSPRRCCSSPSRQTAATAVVPGGSPMTPSRGLRRNGCRSVGERAPATIPASPQRSLRIAAATSIAAIVAARMTAA